MSNPKNFMDYVPRRNRNYQYEVDKDGKVTILVKWTGPYHKIATVLFKKPEVSRIDLDEIGSWVWLAMDGHKTVYDLSREDENVVMYTCYYQMTALGSVKMRYFVCADLVSGPLIVDGGGK